MVESWIELNALLPSLGVKIGMAVLCGLILGVERERKDKPAGLRTLVLITVGATIYMIVSELIPLVSEGSEATLRIDPGRVAAQVVTGIGFLGAGTIIQARGSVHGLTTAAVIWVAAGIGLTIGIGFPLMALAVTLVVVVVLVLLDPLRNWLTRGAGEHRSFRFSAPNDTLQLEKLRLTIRELGLHDYDLTVHPLNKERVRVDLTSSLTQDAVGHLLAALAGIDGVRGMPETEE